MEEESIVWTSKERGRMYDGTLIVVTTVSLSFLIVWVFLRRTSPRFFLRKCFAPKWGIPLFVFHRLTIHSPKDLFVPTIEESSGWFRWFFYLLWTDEETEIFNNYGGFESVLYLTWLRYSSILWTVLTAVSLCLVLPLNATAGGRPSNLDSMRSTMINIKQESNRMWVHLSVVYLVSALVYYFCHLYMQKVSYYKRLEFLLKNRPRSHAIMVSDIPFEIRSEPLLRRTFEEIYRSQNIAHVIMAPDVPHIRKMQEARKKSSERLSIISDRLSRRGSSWNSHRNEFLSRLSIQVQKMEFGVENEQKKFERKLEENEAECNQPVAFVVFSFMPAALMALETIHDGELRGMTVRPAPEGNDIVWEHLGIKKNARRLRTAFSFILLLGLFFSWIVPMSIVIDTANMEDLPKFLYERRHVISRLNLKYLGIFTGFLPALIFIITITILPHLIRVVHNFSRPKLRSHLDSKIFRTFYYFLVLQLATVILFGTSLREIRDVYHRPAGIIDMMNRRLPDSSSFFCHLILLSIASSVVQFVDLQRFLCVKIRGLYYKTHYQLAKLSIPSSFSFAPHMAYQSFIFSVGLIFCTYNPVVSLFTAIYFGFNWISSKHQLVFFHTPAYEGYNVTRSLMRSVLTGLMMYQGFMFAVFFQQKFSPGIASLPLILVDLLLFFLTFRKIGKDSYPPLLIPSSGGDGLAEVKDTYTDPAMKEPREYDAIVNRELVFPNSEPSRPRAINVSQV
ncbi:hypothetical protein PROFUN_05653 [Planoprotostelium fungivorum]|uniref:Uncharacterized protein n=1 Tax=Planoprotostelium fungivorum TaxID=1890364 RepID=A0A2P6MUF4_9EUKA|nr:hypothetical protein PROFUN_05653 [Planoprotostelium fungivorum]